MLDRDDRSHDEAKRTFATFENEERVTHSYVLVETTAIAHRRLGEVAVRRFVHELVPVLSTVWIDEATHAAGVAALLAALPTRISLVDFISRLVSLPAVALQAGIQPSRNLGADPNDAGTVSANTLTGR